MSNKEILQRLDEIKRILDIINLRLDGIDNDIYSMKTWICGFDREEGSGSGKNGQTGQKADNQVRNDGEKDDEFIATKVFG